MSNPTRRSLLSLFLGCLAWFFGSRNAQGASAANSCPVQVPAPIQEAPAFIVTGTYQASTTVYDTTGVMLYASGTVGTFAYDSGPRRSA